LKLPIIIGVERQSVIGFNNTVSKPLHPLQHNPPLCCKTIIMNDSDQESDFTDTFMVPPSDADNPFPEDIRARFLVDADATHDGCPDNPTKIDKPFWKYMIARPGLDGYHARKKLGLMTLDALNKGPVFCFQRFGMTETKLPDGVRWLRCVLDDWVSLRDLHFG
jgi:hypothetical protein